MTKEELSDLLGGWQGYHLGTVERIQISDTKRPHTEVWIELLRNQGEEMMCSNCGNLTCKIHDWDDRWIRDLPIFDMETKLRVQRCRVKCPNCGPKLEAIPWLNRYSRVTERLAASIARLCGLLPVEHVASWFGLGWDQVKKIDKAALDLRLNPADLTGIEELAMDEFALHKGHRYATVIADPSTKRVLWIGEGRSREDIRPFFEMLGPDGCARIKAVAMDMNGGFEAEVRAQCPNAEVVFDFFHVVMTYGREVIDSVRKEEAGKCGANSPARKLIKGSRWLLLKNRENINKEKDIVKLDELLAANEQLMTVYVLKDDLKEIWRQRSAEAAFDCWIGWMHRAFDSNIKQLIDFTGRMSRHLMGILAHAKHPLHTGLLEGINNTIKVIKRMAYGFRDAEYFFQKIRAAFPGNHG